MVQLDNEGEREFLAAVEEAEGRAGTTWIRQATGMDSSEVQYRFKTLEDKGLIETEYDSDATPEGVAPMRVAVLTGLAKEEMDKGLLGEGQLEQLDEARDVESLLEEVEELREQVAMLEGELESFRERVNTGLVPMVNVHRDSVAVVEELVGKEWGVVVGEESPQDERLRELARRTKAKRQ